MFAYVNIMFVFNNNNNKHKQTFQHAILTKNVVYVVK